MAARPDGMRATPKATSMFQQVILKNASSANRTHWPRGTARDWPPARSAANSTAEPQPRHMLRKVHGGTSPSATFMAVQLKPQAKVRAERTHHRRRGRWSGSLKPPHAAASNYLRAK